MSARAKTRIAVCGASWVERTSTIAGSLLQLIDERGVSVITDIDDTIKITAVTNRRELLMNTFLREFRAVSGMAELYRRWATGGAAFHYVSSSPWQLFSVLSEYTETEAFPAGSMHLRSFRLRRPLQRKWPELSITSDQLFHMMFHVGHIGTSHALMLALFFGFVSMGEEDGGFEREQNPPLETNNSRQMLEFLNTLAFCAGNKLDLLVDG